MGLLFTTHGNLDASLLVRSVKFEDKPREFVVIEEWRLPDHDVNGCSFCSAPDAPPHDGISRDILVKNNVWVHLKEASVVAEGIAGGLNG